MPGTTTDTVPAMLTPGEFVIKRESAKMLGLPFLRKLNEVSDNAAHDNMDALIAQAELSNMKPMFNGGEVVPGYKKGDVVKPMSAGIIANLLSMASSKYRPEANERLTPEEEILLELLNQSDKAEASVSPFMLGEVIPYMGGEMKPPMVEDSDVENEPIRSPFKGYKDGDIVSDDPLQIDKRMADPSIYNRSVISGQWGDERPIPEAWMQPATEPMPTAEDKKEFEKQLNRLKIDLLINKILSKDSQDTLRPKGYQKGNIVTPNNLDSLSWDDIGKVIESDDKKKTNELMEMIKVQGIFNEPERNYASYFEREFEVPSNMAGSVKKAYSNERDMENQKALELLQFMSSQSGSNMMDYTPSKSVPMPFIDKSWYVK